MAVKDVLGIGAVAVALIGYVPYLRDMLRNKTKPHAVSWLLWGLLAGIAFLGQVAGHAGPGAWVTGVTAAVSLAICALSLVKGTRDIAPADWLSLGGAAVALAWWLLTKEPLLSVVLITVINALAFFPTWRKSFHQPREETVALYALSGPKYVFALVSLESFSLLTALYPLSLVVMNGLFVATLLVQRRRRDSPTLEPAPDAGASPVA